MKADLKVFVLLKVLAEEVRRAPHDHQSTIPGSVWELHGRLAFASPK